MINHSLTFQHKSNWIQKNAVILTTSENMVLVVKELIRSVGWNMTGQAKNVEQAIQYIQTGRANLVIIDDRQDLPAISAVRELISHPLGVITPILTFLMDKNLREQNSLSKLAHLKVAPKPVTPSSFYNSFQNLIRHWDQQEMLAIRLGASKAAKTDAQTNLAIFTRLSEIASIRDLVARPLSLTQFQMGHIKEAEKTILLRIAEKPSDLGLIITLGHIYLHSAMPKLANRIFKSAYTKNQDSNLLIPDIILSALLMEDYPQCVNFLNILVNREYMPSFTSQFLGRTLFGSGLHRQSAFILGTQDNLFRKIEAQWKTSQDFSADKAG